jgi:hypothetical protein
MNLVSGNDPDFVQQTIRSALETYRSKDNPQAALDVLVKLKGIGPATASLLLTVHDPERIIFFSDEAFYWLCGKGHKVPIKYNAKEYVALRSAAEELRARLDVTATDIEKVAYVLMKSPAGPATSSSQPQQPTGDGKSQGTIDKRKVEKPTAPDAGRDGLRRSKRAKK